MDIFIQQSPLGLLYSSEFGHRQKRPQGLELVIGFPPVVDELLGFAGFNFLYSICIHVCIHIYILIGGLNPSEKYEFVTWDDDIPTRMESHNPAMFQTTNHIYIYYYFLFWWVFHQVDTSPQQFHPLGWAMELVTVSDPQGIRFGISLGRLPYPT